MVMMERVEGRGVMECVVVKESKDGEKRSRTVPGEVLVVGGLW